MRLGVAPARARSAARATRARPAASPATLGIDVSRPSRTNARSTLASFGGRVAVLVADGARGGLGARRELRTPPEQARARRRPVDHEAAGDEAVARACTTRRAFEAVSACMISSVVDAPSTSAATTLRRSSSARRPTSSPASSGGSGRLRQRFAARRRSSRDRVQGCRHARRSNRRQDDPRRHRPSRRRRLRCRRVGRDAGPTRASTCSTASSPTATPAASTRRCPRSEIPRIRREEQTERREDGRRQRAALPRLSRRPARVDARPAPRHLARHPPGAPRPHAVPVARTQLLPHLREPSRPPAAGEAAVCAVYPDARNPWAHPELLQDEGLEPHTVPELWLMAANNADHFVDTPRRSTARSPRCCATRARCPTRSHPHAHHRLGRRPSPRWPAFPRGSYAEGFQRIETT